MNGTGPWPVIPKTSSIPWAVPCITSTQLINALRSPAAQGKKITFIDCQDGDQNAGEIQGALHLYLAADGKEWGQGGIDSLKQLLKNDEVWSNLVGSDLLVIYCSAGATRSPSITKHYLKELSDRKHNLGTKQVVLLEKGVGEYRKVLEAAKKEPSFPKNWPWNYSKEFTPASEGRIVATLRGGKVVSGPNVAKWKQGPQLGDDKGKADEPMATLYTEN